ncbi:MAG: von Willebrand factor type A domain-containing protein [Planctomycetota bacterium]|jgi:Ca-activated chloride channel family protein|nr:von Willebrand factor type A domain-containing protein [Planctomycetota bacterium]
MSDPLPIPEAAALDAALQAYADGAFGEKDRARAEALLDAHPELRLRVEQLRREGEALRCGLGETDIPTSLDEVRRARISAAAAARPRRSVWTPVIRIAAVVVVIAAGGGLLMPALGQVRAPGRVVDLNGLPASASATSSGDKLGWADEQTVPTVRNELAWAGQDKEFNENYGYMSNGRSLQDQSRASGMGQAVGQIAAEEAWADMAVTESVVTELDLPVEEMEGEGLLVPRDGPVSQTEMSGSAPVLAIGAGVGARERRRKDLAGFPGSALSLPERPARDIQTAEAAQQSAAAEAAESYYPSAGEDYSGLLVTGLATAEEEGRGGFERLGQRGLKAKQNALPEVAKRIVRDGRESNLLSGRDEALREIDVKTRLGKEEASTPASSPPPAPVAQPAKPKSAEPKPAPITSNPWVITADDAQSTFAIDTDRASYRIAGRAIATGDALNISSIRVEEFVNAFDYAYPATGTAETFSLHAQAGPAPYGEAGTVLLKLGVKAKVLGRDGQRPAHLVFVVDNSGSMGLPDRLPVVRAGIAAVLPSLAPQDRITVVAAGGSARLIVDHAPAGEAAMIMARINELPASGDTNLEAGLRLGYQQAAARFRAGAVNRVVLCSDGVATVGAGSAAALLASVRDWRQQGIGCTTVGVGAGAYDDALLERLANDGDGHYLYIDTEETAGEAFVDELSADLNMVARDAKIQVAFDPATVRRYRLLGYENRAIADRDFRNDSVDAGEVGSGQSATALYELELEPGASADLGELRVRWFDIDATQASEISYRLRADLSCSAAISARPRFYLAAAAAEFAEILRDSEHSELDYRPLLRDLDQIVAALPMDQQVRELRQLVAMAAQH